MLSRFVSRLRRIFRRPLTNEALFRRQARQWNRIGEKAPYWSVLSGCAKTHTIPEADVQEFYRSGADEVELMQDFFRYAGCTLPSGTCVDWGCGLGRVTIHLATRFQHVVGVDISAAHLKIARQHTDDLGLKKTGEIVFYNLVHDQEALDELNGQVDLVHSILTLQHMPPPLMLETLTAFARLLKSGGYAFFQIPTYGENYDYRKFDHDHTSDIEMHALAQREIHALFREQECDAVATFEKDRTGPGFLSHYFIFQKR